MSSRKNFVPDGADCFAEDFKNINLSNETVKRVEFEECTFTSCDFSETLFHSCRFIDCHFFNCNMSVMKLTDSIVSGCDFVSSKMIGIDWSMCDWKSYLNNEPLKFKQSILNDSNFYGLSQDGIEMLECSVRDVDFCAGSFKNANFSLSDFKGSVFHETHLESANFTDATNTNINLTHNHLKGAIFSQSEALYLLESMGIVLVG